MLLCSSSFADEIKGRVYGSFDGKKEPLEDVIVKWINTTKGTITDNKGFFEIQHDNITDTRLIITYTGFTTDTVEITNEKFVEVTLATTNTE